jgi:predicted chitinase
MDDNLNNNKRISAASLVGRDRYNQYIQELSAQGTIAGQKLSPTERKEAFRKRNNKVQFKTFVEKVLQKKATSTARVGSIGIKALPAPGGALVKFKPQQEVQKSSFSILKVLNSILNTLKNQFKFDKKKETDDKKEEENEERKKRESALEGTKKIGKKILDKVIAPFKSIFDRIWNFIFFTLLGRAFTQLMNWFGDPKNAQKVQVLGRFLKDWWPALLGLYFMPFKGFMVTTLARIAGFAAKFALRNPAGVLAGLNILGAQKNKETVSRMVGPEKIKEAEKAVEEARKSGDTLKLKQALDTYNMVSGNEALRSGLQINPSAYASGGLINPNTGIRISGAGPDTQLTALQPGEVVMNRAAVKRIGAERLLKLNSMFGGSNANRPRFANNIQFAQNGGMVGAFGKGSSQFGEVPLIREALKAGIKGNELAAFLAQMSHETGGFKWNRELGRGEGMGYSGGSRYHGRGYTQLTHDYNYRDFGKKMGVDLLKDPDLLLKDPSLSARSAIEYWKARVRPNVKNWNDVFAHSAAINYPSATSPDQITGYSDRLSRFNYYNKNLKSIVSRSVPKPKPNQKANKGLFSNIFNLFAMGKRGGGLIGETTGIDIPGSTADRQLTALQPGEYVLPVDTVNSLGKSLIDKLVAMTDSNSNPTKLGKRNGRYMPGPLSRGGKGGIITLPPITQSSAGQMPMATAGSEVPSFSTVAPMSDRGMIADIYGIV